MWYTLESLCRLMEIGSYNNTQNKKVTDKHFFGSKLSKKYVFRTI